MQLNVRSFLLLAIVTVPITLTTAACTRERPTPAPTATAAVQASAPTASSNEPEVLVTTPQTQTEGGLTTAPLPSATPTPGAQEFFQYVVREGDTLSTIAERFETDVETLRRLNNLDNDGLLVGQPLNVPYREGMTEEGAPTPTPGPFLYTVQAGDTLSGIAGQFGLSTIELMEANAENILDPNNLTVGSVILIPNYSPPAATTDTETTDGAATAAPDAPSAGSQDSVTHVVQPGQSLIAIAVLYGVGVDEIVAANNLTDQNTLRVGQELVIPGVNVREAAAARGALHVVQAGESLLSIAIQYGITVPDIEAANDLDNPDSIFVGQELIIPLP